MDIQQSTTQTEPAIISSVAQPTVKKPLQGISGWLILPIIGLFYMLYKTVMMLLQEISQVQTAWPLATQADSDFYIPGFATGFYLLQLGYGVLIALFLWTFIAAVKWKKQAKWLFIITMVLFTLMVLVARFVFPYIFGLEINHSNIITAINGSFYCVLWIPYFLVSHRVKNTFIH
ncbi:MULTISPECIES: DUF2569 family protein [Providencia]|uniref:DUF2569 family protein n=1 Tax=Providencia TaxID=586 RepID=UPI0018E46D0C|nr:MULTISPECIES: DUF2569 family protein [Providencia]EJD6375687.1 DUF2569 family protein [Providencia rettgeri]EJF7710075.1 DUF2569 family protein [Providencia rettgeri]ELR5116188.1 DUF2569 family protein [Providencia rettgeri]MBI6203357.1 DUF2569 family protein [Providencia rettgeri]MCG5279666.1 DUF2569 domain-containing protein [Providencia rettgeri]